MDECWVGVVCDLCGRRAWFHGHPDDKRLPYPWRPVRVDGMVEVYHACSMLCQMRLSTFCRHLGESSVFADEEEPNERLA